MTYIFKRSNGWYPVDIANDDEAVRQAMSNPGTVSVETADGRVVFPLPCHNN